MTEPESEESLVAQAVAGDVPALERLLLNYHDRLARRLGRKIPASLKNTVSVEDILQEAYVGAFRSIRTFRPNGDGAFYRWLATIAEHRLLDSLKAHRAGKRNEARRVAGPGVHSEDSSLVEWVELAAGREPTPSTVAARHEAVQAMQVALAGLKPHYREALELRYLKGKSVDEVAALMGRTPGAVMMLCQRGMDKLREALGRASLYLSSR